MSANLARAHTGLDRESFDLTCVIDLDGALRTVDSSTERALGFAANELVGRTLSSLVQSADQRALSDALVRVREGASVVDLELRVRRRNGPPLRSSWSLHPVAGQQMALAFAKDLSDSHEEAGSPAHAQLAAVLDALDLPICIADLEDGTMLLANGPFRARFGENVSEDIASAERGFAIAPSERFDRSMLINERGEPGGVQVGEFHHLADQRSYLVRAIAIRWTPRRLARLHAFVDITHRVESERFQRAQQEKLLLTSRWMSVGELASTLAHELNQPLGAITNYVRGAIRRLGAEESNTGGVVGALEHALLQAEHAAKVVSRIREFVRTREPRREPVPLADLVNGVVQLIEAEAHKHLVKLRLTLPAELPPAFADRVMIEQVVLNLVKNAIEAMDATPQGAREVSISAGLNPEGLLELAVEDTGSGLTAETREQIFSPFFTTKQDGMGIGLSICRSIIEYHDGGLFFTSTPGGGARFWFTLPQAQ